MDTSTTSQLLTELQSQGLRLADASAGAPSRRGGAGPSDHKAVTIDGRTIMVPVHSADARASAFEVGLPRADGSVTLKRNAIPIKEISFPKQPRFYKLQTFDGIPYWKIATLHGSDVLATTVLQTCVRYGRRSTSCQFCAIGESLKGERTINRKTPEQLGEVARAAMLLDGIQHMVMTTGTPNFTDRGAELNAFEAVFLDHTFEFGNRRFRMLHRQRRHAAQAIRFCCHHLREAVIDQTRSLDRQIVFQVVEKALRSGRNECDVDFLAVHRFKLGIGIVELRLERETRLAANEYPVVPLALDLCVVDRIRLHGLDQGLGNHVVVYIDAFHAESLS